jgi:XTP/dITP diphosphohydrolase
MKKLLIATTNPGKLDEIRRFLADLPIELVSLKDIGITESVEETGATFEENAILKSAFYAKKSGLPALADDGGFEIDALKGEPGVRSHRWIDPTRESADEELIAYAFERMKDVPQGKRGAQLRLVLALTFPDGSVHTVTDAARGVVPFEPSHERVAGFPYRSILYIPPIGKFYNHDLLTPEETDKYNHRKRALDQLKPILQKYLTQK